MFSTLRSVPAFRVLSCTRFKPTNFERLKPNSVQFSELSHSSPRLGWEICKYSYSTTISDGQEFSLNLQRSLPHLNHPNICRNLSRKSGESSEKKWTSKLTGNSSKLKTQAHISDINRRRKEAIRKIRLNVKLVSRKSKEKVNQFVENIYTVPNALTLSRIILSPVIGGLVLTDHYSLALGLFCFAGITDFFDGIIARRYPGQQTVLGSVLDPLADKLLISILYVTLTAQGIIPLALTGLVLARDFALVLAAFYVRFISLPPPRTFARYWDVNLPSAQAKPTFISKVNTAIQLGLVAASLPAPVFGYVDHQLLQYFWYLTASTTVASGFSYLLTKGTVEILSKKKRSSHKNPRKK